MTKTDQEAKEKSKSSKKVVIRKKNDHAAIKKKNHSVSHLTPTQRRNARKRRAKQKQKQIIVEDPSIQYMAHPRRAPTVQRAIRFFSNLQEKKDFPVHLGPTEGWRTVAKLAVRMTTTTTNSHPKGKKQQQQQQSLLSIGLYQPGSHELIAVPDCPAHHPSINRAVACVQKLARQNGIAAFDEATGQGNLRHVAVNVERATGKVQMTLVWNDANDANATATNSVVTNSNMDKKGATMEHGQQLDRLCQQLIELSNKQDSSFLHSLWIHYNSSWKHDNAVFSRNGLWEKRFGPDCLTEYLFLKKNDDDDDDDQQFNSASSSDLMINSRLMMIPLHFGPQVFRQANLDGFAGIVDKIRCYLQKSKQQQQRCDNKKEQRCLELYGGVGTIGLHVLDLCTSLITSDENPYNQACFEASVQCIQQKQQQQQQQHCSVAQYRPVNASKMVQSGALQQADWVIVDPPRKGLDEAVVQGLCRVKRPHLLVYVSCGFDAFQRDCQTLLREGGWTLDEAAGYILFPGSDAIETLAFFTR